MITQFLIEKLEVLLWLMLAGVTAMFDAAIIIASVRMLVAYCYFGIISLFVIKKHHLARFKARILRLNAFAR